MTTGLVRAGGGKSHSWLTPTISRSNPSAKRISVADGSNDTIRIMGTTLTQLWRRLFVEEIFAADLVGVSDEQQEFLGIELLRIESVQNHGNLQAHAHRAHRAALGNAHRYAAATFAAIETDDGDKGLRGEMQTGKMTPVQCGGDIVAVEPGSPKFFKRGLRAATDGDTGVLQNFNAGVKNGTLRSAEIRRGRNPLDARALKEIVAVPVFHGDDVKIGADVILGVEKLGELADRQAVPHRRWKISDEICFVGVEHRAFHDFTAERIGTVENEESDLAFGGFLHAISHRCRVRVKPDAGVLNVEDECVNALEHFIRGTERFAIETMDGKAGGGIFGGSDLFIVAAGEAMLRTEQSNQLNPRGMG